MSLAETAGDEVVALHAFFEAWYRGEAPRTNEGIARLEDALGAGFRLVGPDGRVQDRGAVIDAVEGRHGAHRDDEVAFQVDVEAVETAYADDDVCLLTYDEHQRTAGGWRGRRSSALFERAPDAPRGVVWRHLHETWLGE